ncbi:MAG: hypothetical protein GY847_32140 [Proteobacteria bacterium]|nr:hypothetical protein [Pseudomonadota bacterium]
MTNTNSTEKAREPDFCVSWWRFKSDQPEFPPTEDNTKSIESDPLVISQRNFRALLDAAICFLRWVTARYTLGQDAVFTISDFRHEGALFKIKSLGDPKADPSEEPTADEERTAESSEDTSAKFSKGETTLRCLVWCEEPLPEDDWNCELVAKFEWKGSKVPQILFEITGSLSKWRRTKDDITYWYYSDVQDTFHLELNPQFQGYLRTYVSALEKCGATKSTKDKTRADEENRIDPADLRSAIIEFFVPAESDPNGEENKNSLKSEVLWLEQVNSESKAEDRKPDISARESETVDSKHESENHVPWDVFSGLLEVTHGLGMIRWNATEPSKIKSATLEVVEPPAATVLLAKIFGLKSSIPGFDPLFGGGLIPNPSIATPDPNAASYQTDQKEQKKPSRIGILGVIRGRFGSGKTTLATQLAIDMAGKGGAGVLLVLEQSVQEALAQAQHYGWLPRKETIKLFIAEPDMEPDVFQDLTNALEEAEREKTGFLFIHKLEDSSLSRFNQWLDDVTEMAAFKDFPLRFIVVDPLDAVLISPKDVSGQSQLLRNRTQQILESATHAGFSLWLCTSHIDAEDKDYHYRFLPNIGDVVIRVAMLAAGERLEEKQIMTRPLRLLEVEKVRTQRFDKGVHPFEILSHGGIQIYPSGESVSRFVTWVDNRPDSHKESAGSEQPPISLGHKALDLALGTKGVRPQSVTTLMGPTGCAKTELALLYLLQTEELQQVEDQSHTEEASSTGKSLENGDTQQKEKMSLFISFRDNWDSLGEILAGPVGEQLHIRNRQKAKEKVDLLLLDVGHQSSGWIFQQIQNQFKNLPPGTRYNRVVMDNLAYMDLTTPLVRNDELFVPNLLAIFAREKVTPLFITSLVEGVKAESKLQTQIRDASHNLIVMKRNRYLSHNFIAVQIFKSQKLRHQPQVFELRIDDTDHYTPNQENIGDQIGKFLGGYTKSQSDDYPGEFDEKKFGDLREKIHDALEELDEIRKWLLEARLVKTLIQANKEESSKFLSAISKDAISNALIELKHDELHEVLRVYYTANPDKDRDICLNTLKKEDLREFVEQHNDLALREIFKHCVEGSTLNSADNGLPRSDEADRTAVRVTDSTVHSIFRSLKYEGLKGIQRRIERDEIYRAVIQLKDESPKINEQIGKNLLPNGTLKKFLATILGIDMGPQDAKFKKLREDEAIRRENETCDALERNLSINHAEIFDLIRDYHLFQIVRRLEETELRIIPERLTRKELDKIFDQLAFDDVQKIREGLGCVKDEEIRNAMNDVVHQREFRGPLTEVDRYKIRTQISKIALGDNFGEATKAVETSLELAIRKKRYLPRAKLAHYLHQAYVLLCRRDGLEPWVNRGNWEKGSGNQGENSTSDGKKECGDDKKGNSRGNVEQQKKREDDRVSKHDWRQLYVTLMEWLEIQRGISIRLHNLDDYDHPMGEEKIQLGGIAQATRGDHGD